MKDFTQQQRAALLALANAYHALADAWDDDWEGPENFGGVLEDLGVLPQISLDEAGSELLHLVDPVSTGGEAHGN